MARVLVVFGTTQGQTARIARRFGDVLRVQGHEVDILNAAAAAPDPTSYDAVIVAASVHSGGYQRPVGKWVSAHAQTLETKPGAFVSVCLGVLQREEQVQQEVARTVSEFVDKCGWHPAMTAVFAGALPYRKYNIVMRWVMKRIVAKAGGDTDTSRNYEYTDWAAVEAFAQRFGELVARRVPAAAAARKVS
jgi:menaquinone-dependent protoporphyrinogen oxidase